MSIPSPLRRAASPALLVLSALAVVPPVLHLADQTFYIGLATRIVILAIAAVSLDLILGFGGMVSLGHAAYLGVGAYSVGILSYYGVTNGFAHLATATLASAAVALLIGASAVRTRGVHFIMISLAFGQMLYYLSVGVSAFGGDDGLSINANSDFGPLDLGDPTALYYAGYAVLLGVLIVLHRLMDSPFGVALRAVKSNDARARAIGLSAYGYRLAAFVVAGTICGWAGVLLANQNLFISPASIHWGRSGELLIIAILGGMGTLTGPVLGSVAYVLLEYFVSRFTEHWQIVLGAVIVAVVLAGAGGLLALTRSRRPRRPAVEPVVAVQP